MGAVIFTEAAFLSPITASRELRSATNPDDLATTVDFLANSFNEATRADQEAARRFAQVRDRFIEASQNSADAGTTMLLVREQLLPVIESVGATLWKKRMAPHRRAAQAAWRFATADQVRRHAAEASRTAQKLWQPAIELISTPEEMKAEGLALVERTLNLLLTFSTFQPETSQEGNWQRRLWGTHLFDYRNLEFEFSPLTDRDPEIVALVQWGESKKKPRITVQVRPGVVLDEGSLAYAILRSFRSLHPLIRLREGEKTGKREASVIFFQNIPHLRPHLPLSLVRTVQGDLIHGSGAGEITRSMQQLQLSKGVIDEVKDLLNSHRIRLVLGTTPDSIGTPRVRFHDLPSQEWQTLLVVELQLPPEQLASLDTDSLWSWLAKALAFRSTHATERGFYYPLEVHPTDFRQQVMDGRIRGEQVRLIGIEHVSEAWRKELETFFRFLMDVRKSAGPFLLPELEEAIAGPVRALLPSSRSKFEFEFKHVPGRALADATFLLVPPTEKTGKTLVMMEVDTIELEQIEPRELLKFFCYVANQIIYRESNLKNLQKLLRTVSNWNETWAWVELLWGEANRAAKTFQPDESGPIPKPVLAGERAAEFVQPIQWGMAGRMVREATVVKDSLSQYPLWQIEIAGTVSEDQTIYANGPLNSATRNLPRGVPLSLQRVTIVTTGRSKLIHFDGQPPKEKSFWDRLVRIILELPEGVTSIDLRSWDSNHPEIVLQEGEERWFELNHKYARTLHPKSKRSYQEALLLIRRLALPLKWKADKGVALVTPTSTARDLINLRKQMSLFYHPDRKESGGVDISDDYHRLLAAFEVVIPFHE